MDFEGFYIKWYSRVKSFAREYVLLEEEAENIVQDVFFWNFIRKRIYWIFTLISLLIYSHP